MRIGLPRKMVLILVAALAIVQAGGTAASAAELVDAAKLDAMSKPLVDSGWIYGAAVGLINEKGTQIVGLGKMSDKDASAPRGDSVFEIGSISKVFTGLILARMVEAGEVALNEPVQKLLGDSMTVPKWEDRQITLVDLATHTSGLPRMPADFTPKDMTNPYADYSVAQLEKFITGCKLPREPGTLAEYSNLGMGLLGHALALKSGMSYEALLRKQVCQPLGMNDTRITLNAAEKARLAQGHDGDGNAVANWDLPTLAGAGAIRSTAADMLKFLAANIPLTKTPLAAAMADSQAVHFEVPDGGGSRIGLAWQLRNDHVVWHNGQTGGYHAFACFSPEKRAGVVVLSNTATLQVDAWGFGLFKLLVSGEAEALKLPKTVKLEPEVLDSMSGDYEIAPQLNVAVTRQGDHLLMQLTGQPKVAFYPESTTRFYCRAVNATVTFEAGEDGAINKLVIHQNAQDLPAPKTK
jgi:serine-type D-Ala-D-Ala carboxypeptidase/endopeptidase